MKAAACILAMLLVATLSGVGLALIAAKLGAML